MKEAIETYLQSFGYSNIRWGFGRKGYFILALSPYGATECIEPQDLLNEMLDFELRLSKKWKTKNY